jgi:MOSC domain-containing protein YiiM
MPGLTEPEGPRTTGRVFLLHRKGSVAGERGLPKHAIVEAKVTGAGIEGDFNLYRHEEKADDPRMALLLLPRETLQELNDEGWPVRPGDLGENITTEGILYRDLSPPGRWRVGSAEVEATFACTPCNNLRALPYVGDAREGAFLRTMIDRRGWYARVRQSGTVRVGDPIVRLQS